MAPAHLPARQQTLRNTLDWSYRLLDAEEQQLFTRLAIFGGGCTIEAAAAVCGPGVDTDILDGLQSLVTKNLLWRGPDVGDEPRFRMHETIREYAVERLEASSEAEALRQRHTDYFLALAEQAAPHLVGPEQQRWLARVQHEQDNLRAALEWSASRDGSMQAVRLVGALLWFWVLHYHVHEARTWFECLLARFPTTVPGGPGSEQRAMLLYGAGMFAYGARDFATARVRLQESAACWRAWGDSRNLAHALTWLGETDLGDGNLVAARAALEESTALLRGLADPFGLTRALNGLGQACGVKGDRVRARAVFEECLGIARDLGEHGGRVGVLSAGRIWPGMMVTLRTRRAVSRRVLTTSWSFSIA